MSQPATGQIKLNAYMSGSGVQGDSWRHPEVDVDAYRNFERYRDIAAALERGRFHSIFFYDNVYADIDALPFHTISPRWDPLVLLSALAVTTRHLGLIGTTSTTYSEPYNVARRFASLDHLSGGRAGWNVVTSTAGGENFNLDAHPDHAERYRRAHEFFDVVTGLWDTWADDAVVADKATGQWVDRAKVRTLDHAGEFFRVRGPLNAARPPQGWPVIAQAGSSESGKDLAARVGEVLFTAETELEHAQAFRADVRARADRIGRNPNHINILPGVSPIVGRTQAEAEDKYGELLRYRDRNATLQALAAYASLGVDLAGLPLDALVPLPDKVAETNSHKSRQALILDYIRKHRPTVAQLYSRFTIGGHRILVGTPESIADDFEHWFTNGASDGFTIMFPSAPGGVNDFVDLVVPELQRRRLFRTEYTGRTFRENLGLPHRPNRHFV
ncbi:LLM class flavin-dependent oxidoreductase [Pseudothauera rhizosphaerae]|uniref:LLM class flavin-dependent oxidoreductase n=1 Tax=Pseudothauera rhizosphaerae TaxID=2565932 RepID=A0A4S4AZU5_9RHOO|nr:LLM class flavin-dependent oxidoreductase [Pseudothauera rhizosphaerae]THF65279.1 LLM class flavin-dependent oxidoreductase [Pseudothauera rhizosphaerae]